MVVAQVGRRAAVYDYEQERAVLIELDTGLTTKLPLWAGTPIYFHDNLARAPLDFCPDGRTYLQLTPKSESKTPSLCIKDLTTGAERFIALGMPADKVRCCSDGRTAIVTLADPSNGEGIIQVIDLARAEKREALNIGKVRSFSSCVLVFAHGPMVAVSVLKLINGRTNEIQLWDLSDKRRIAVILNECTTGYNCDGHLVTAHFGGSSGFQADRLRLLDGGGNEIRQWQPAPEGPHWPAYLGPTGRNLFDWNQIEVPAWRTWLHKHFPRLLSADPSGDIHVYDARSGKLQGTVAPVPSGSTTRLSPDGKFLGLSARGTISVWDIPPRKAAGGIVLGLMIAEVALFVACTEWRRRSKRRRLVAT
jgi:WD40 repeat protein